MKTEFSLLGISILAVLFKIQHYPGGSVLFLLSLFGLAVLYTFFGFYFFSYKNLKTQVLPLSILAGPALATALLGVLFKIQHYPGAMPMLMGGSLFAFVVAIASLFMFQKSKNGSKEELHTLSTDSGDNLLDDFIQTNENRAADMNVYFKRMIGRSLSLGLFCIGLMFIV